MTPPGAEIERWVAGLSAYADRFLSNVADEETFVNCLGEIVAYSGHRSALRSNLWKLVDKPTGRTRKDWAVLMEYAHPLQPDIDLLVETLAPQPTFSAHEVKIIRWDEASELSAYPKSRLYEGLGQALALCTYGVDFCYLWHVFVPPMAAYRALEARSPDWAERINDVRVEFTAAYGGILRGILSRFSLPIGYVALAVFADKASQGFHVAPFRELWLAPTRLAATPTGAKVRRLLERALEEQVLPPGR